METMHAAGRRTLPPVPRTGGERGTARPDVTAVEAAESPADIPTQRFVVDFSADTDELVPAAGRVPAPRDRDAVVRDAVVRDQPPTAERAAGRSDAPLDASQQFVERLRAAAPDFAEAAGAESAVVREAVPPARHRRSRCRVVLRYADDTEADVTFLGPTGSPGRPSRHGFERQIRRWFDDGQRREAAWLVPDEDAAEGSAIDVNAWLGAG